MPKLLKVLTYPHPVLREKAEPIEEIDDEIRCLIDDMGETMYAAPGIGLAANQVGVTKQVIVYDVSPKKDNGKHLSALINPEIVEADGSITIEEACLSVLDFSADVERKERVVVKGLDKEGRPVTIEAEGLKAVCLQHEIDHLKGVLFIDHVSALKRGLYKKRIKKKLQKREREGRA